MSSNFVINPYSISFENIRDDLMAYVQDKPEGEGWKDFYAASAGQTIIELAAALGAFYAYQFLLGRREAYLSTALNYSSVLGAAQYLGYSASRGNNVHLTLTVVPNALTQLRKWDVIGSYQEYDIVSLTEGVLNANIPTTIDVVIGTKKVQSIAATTNELTSFSFNTSDVTNDFYLTLNGNEVPVSSTVADALNDKYIAISNAYGSVDVFYYQQGDYRYGANDILSLYYISRNNLTFNDLAMSEINLDFADEPTRMIEAKAWSGLEDIASIKVKAPIEHEMAHVIRSRHDYSKFLSNQFNDVIKDANDYDITPGLIGITYLKHDNSFMTDAENAQWLNAIEIARPSGVARAIIVDPVRVEKTIHIKFWPDKSGNITAATGSAVIAIINTYESGFGSEISTADIENFIEKQSGILIARASFDYDEWKANTNFRTHTVIKPDLGVNSTVTYELLQVKHKTGTSEPAWPTTIGAKVIDGEIVWQRQDAFAGDVSTYWQESRSYDQFTFIKPNAASELTYMCIGFVGKTGQIEPDWTVLNDTMKTLTDGTLVWEKLDDNIEDKTITWSDLTNFKIGDAIYIPSKDISLRAIDVLGTTGETEPDWANLTSARVEDGNIVWTLRDANADKLQLNWNEYLKLTITTEAIE